MDWIDRFSRVLLDTSVRILAVAAIVALLLAVLRVRRGAVRHAAWCAVLAAMLGMPALRLLAASLDVRVEMPAAIGIASNEWLAGPVADRQTPSAPDPIVSPRTIQPAGPSPAVERSVSSRSTRSSSWGPAAFAVYVGGLLVMAARFGFGWHRTRRLAAAGRPLASSEAALFESDAVAAPVTIGTLAPRILLPSAWTSWPAWKLDAVLAHERAHIRRRDPVVLLFVQINRCLFWFHPLAWWLDRAIRNAAEQACDDAAVNATGRPRQYAETLLDVADAIRRSGAAVSWNALGASGSGNLGARIDRALQGGSPRTPAYRTAALGMACALAVAAAAACRPSVTSSVAQLQPDPAFAAAREKSLKEQQVRVAEERAGRGMSLEDVAAVEARVRTNTADPAELERLIAFYTWRENHPLPWNDLIVRRRPIAVSIIKSHAERPIALRASTLFRPSSDPAGREQAAAAWRAEVERARGNPVVLRNASAFFSASDARSAIDLLERARSHDPEATVVAPGSTSGARYWSGQLGILYAAAISGRIHMGGFPVSSAVDDALAQSLRERLGTSSDARMLAAAGSALLRASGIDAADPVRRLGLEYLDRASQLDPTLVEARVQAVNARRSNRERAARQRLLAAQTAIIGAERLKALTFNDPERYRLLREAEPQAMAMLSEQDRFVLLASLGRFADEVTATSRKDADEALSLAAKFKDDPAYAAVVYDANITLSRYALANGDKAAAVAHLREASSVPASDDIKYGYELVANRALKPLLDSGEHAAVIEYLERLAQTSVASRERLLKSAEAIKAGRMPDWYQVQSASR